MAPPWSVRGGPGSLGRVGRLPVAGGGRGCGGELAGEVAAVGALGFELGFGAFGAGPLGVGEGAGGGALGLGLLAAAAGAWAVAAAASARCRAGPASAISARTLAGSR